MKKSVLYFIVFLLFSPAVLLAQDNAIKLVLTGNKFLLEDAANNTIQPSAVAITRGLISITVEGGVANIICKFREGQDEKANEITLNQLGTSPVFTGRIAANILASTPAFDLIIKYKIRNKDTTNTFVGFNIITPVKGSNGGAGLNDSPNATFTKCMVYDAITLAHANLNEDDKLKILQYYGGSDITLNDLSAEKNSILSNELINKVGGTGTQSNKETKLSLNSTLSSLGGLDVTTIADGFAKFIVKRTKAELNVAFFEKFKTFIDKYPDVQSLYPNTYRTLSNIGNGLYNYNIYLNTLRENFNTDLKALPNNLPSIIDNHEAFFNYHPELKFSLESSFYLTNQLRTGVHPGDIIAEYPIYYFDGIATNNANVNQHAAIALKGGIQTLQLISEALHDTIKNSNSSKYWVSPGQLKVLVNDDNAFSIFLGLLQLKNNRNEWKVFYDKDKKTTLDEALKQFEEANTLNRQEFKNYLTALCNKANNLNAVVRQFNNQELKDSAKIELYYSYYNATQSLLKQGFDVTKLPYIKDIPTIKSINKELILNYFNIADASSNLVMEVNRRHYASAVNDVATLYDLIFKKQWIENIPTNLASAIETIDGKLMHEIIADFQYKYGSNGLEQIITKLIEGKNIDSTFKININNIEKIKELSRAYKKELYGSKAFAQIKAGKVTIDLEEKDIKILNAVKDYLLKYGNLQINHEMLSQFLKYSTFMASLANAKSSDEVESLIESFVLPQGSSRIKRESAFNVSLNAYCGLFGGYERMKGIDPCWLMPKTKVVNTFGVTAPIGIAVSKNFGHSSFSVFASVVDLGAITAYRFGNDSLATIPTVHLKDIVSPGLFVSWGVPKCPISLNFGYQMGPILRAVGSKENTYSNAYSRWSFSAVVDLPLLNFYTKSKE